MATPEEIALVQGETGPDLRVIPGGLAVEQTVQIVPNIADMPEDGFKEHVDSVLGRDDELGALVDIDHAINAASAQLNIEIAELTQKLHDLYSKKRWVHGYISDRK